MVEFLPFEGLRPNIRAGEHVGDRVSPPYDVIGPEELSALQSLPYNITNLTLKPDPDRRYGGSRAELDRWISEGALKRDPPSFYVYEQGFDDRGTPRVRRGIVGILRAEPYDAGNVMPHEETFSKVKADRLNLLRDMEAHLESIFGIFPGLSPELSRRARDAERLVFRHVDGDGVEHRFYRLSDPDVVSAITEEVRDQRMLIADGHHRYETALSYALENPDDQAKQYVLATLVPMDDEGLVIWPTHRLVKAGNISERNAAKAIESALATTEVSREEMLESLPDHMMGLVFKSGRCLLADCDAGDDPLLALDTYVAQQRILRGVYKADEGKAEVDYDADARSVLEKMDAREYDLAVILNEPRLRTIWDLASSGRRMPKKTTYFFPKIWSGFVVYLMRRAAGEEWSRRWESNPRPTPYQGVAIPLSHGGSLHSAYRPPVHKHCPADRPPPGVPAGPWLCPLRAVGIA